MAGPCPPPTASCRFFLLLFVHRGAGAMRLFLWASRLTRVCAASGVRRMQPLSNNPALQQLQKSQPQIGLFDPPAEAYSEHSFATLRVRDFRETSCMDELGNVDCRRTAEESTPSRDPSHPFTPAVGARPRRQRASPRGERPGRHPRRGRGSPNSANAPSPCQGRDAATAAVVLNATAPVFRPGASAGARSPPPSRPSWCLFRHDGQRQCMGADRAPLLSGDEEHSCRHSGRGHQVHATRDGSHLLHP